MTQAVHVRGDLLRVEEPPGEPETIIGTSHVWHRDRETGAAVIKERRPDGTNPYTAPRILVRYPSEFWQERLEEDRGILSSVARTVAHGRDALSFEQRGQQGDAFQITVDTATGVWLEALHDRQPWLLWDWVHFEPVEDSKFEIATEDY
ncbi:hypothetical protein EXE59_16775 [Nocardioides eburneiflavus]|uniref:Uncharacterized protein n=1 Tax=Nocardioides eburneiflavus TaxID=2518372 RepID=A0A4Z1CH88_9ACTN|nr:hypothetical protein [Nocardioides eburneiflavus]TGN65428.1 hypothetical protein EXE59_16775 [Nocardioides eburneiflavus]